jgi:uncharacterized caspase-like protein
VAEQLTNIGDIMKRFTTVFFSLLLIAHFMFSQETSNRSRTFSFEEQSTNFKIPKIWAVVIGVSKYQKSEMNLGYADRDAQFFYDYLTSPSGGNVSKDNSALLLNEQATRSNILKELVDKCNRSFEDDLFILYIAGHGVPDPVGNEIYFLSYESQPDNLTGTAVSQVDIEKVLARTKAKKKVWIVDACHSGGAGLNVNVRGDRAYQTNRMLIGIATSSEGIALFTASSASEYSQEAKKWGEGHGVFTHYLLEGLSGKAETDNDGLISIRELYDYVYHKVVDDTKGQQHPELKGVFDNNLPLGVVK